MGLKVPESVSGGTVPGFRILRIPQPTFKRSRRGLQGLTGLAAEQAEGGWRLRWEVEPLGRFGGSSGRLGLLAAWGENLKLKFSQGWFQGGVGAAAGP